MKNYSEIRTAILQTLERENDTVANVLVDQWLRLAEDDFAPMLKAPWAERFATFTYQANGPFEYLPPSYVGMVNLIDTKSNQALSPITPQQIPDFAGNAGDPTKYCVVGYTLILLPMTTIDRVMWLFYHSRQEQLTAEKPVNDVTKNASSIYYYGALRHAAVYYGETENLAMWNAAFDQAITNANGSSVEWRRGAEAPEWRGP